MLKRGKILRDTNAGPGLLTLEGKQYVFTLEQMWVSDVPPRVGMTVEVRLNSDNAPEQVSAVSESQLARETAGAALTGARRHSKTLRNGLFKEVGLGTLAGTAVLLFSWLYLPSLLIQMSYSGSRVSFWGFLCYLAAPNTAVVFGSDPQFLSSGIWGLSAFVALLAPFAGVLWKDRRAAFGGTVPLLFMIIAIAALRASFSHTTGTAAGNTGIEGLATSIANEAVTRAWQSTTFGAGLYISFVAALYLAIAGARNVLRGRN